MRKRLTRDDGGTLVELMFAMAILLVVLVGFQTMLVTSLKTYGSSRRRTIATQVANDEIENDRRLQWSDLGTPSGAAVGTIVTPRTVVLNGQSFRIDTVVEYIDDPVDPTYSVGSNYKRVAVTVTGPSGLGEPVTLETYVAPPNQPSRSKGAIKVSVLELVTTAAVVNAQVKLLVGPSAPRTGYANSEGKVNFGDLTPTTTTGSTTTYQIDGSMAGFLRVPEDNPGQASVSTTLDPSQSWPTVVHLYRPVSLVVDVVDWLNRPITAGGSVTVAGDGVSQAFVLPVSGQLSLATVGGKAVRPDKLYTVTPTVTGKTFTTPSITDSGANAYSAGDYTANFKFSTPKPPSEQQKVKVVDSTGTVVGGVQVKFTGGPDNVTMLDTTTGAGIATFSVVPDGSITYNAHVNAGPTWVATDATVTVSSPPGLATMTLTGLAPVTQTVTVLTPLGVPAAGVAITFTGGPGNVSMPGMTNAAGSADFTVVPDPGVPYTVHVPAGPGWAAADKSFLVATLAVPYVVTLTP